MRCSIGNTDSKANNEIHYNRAAGSEYLINQDISITSIKQTEISLSFTIISALNDSSSWDNISWAPEQEWTSTGSRASSEHSGSSTSTVRFVFRTGDAGAAPRSIRPGHVPSSLNAIITTACKTERRIGSIIPTVAPRPCAGAIAKP